MKNQNEISLSVTEIAKCLASARQYCQFSPNDLQVCDLITNEFAYWLANRPIQLETLSNFWQIALGKVETKS